MLDQLLASRALRFIDVQAARLLERLDQGQCQELPVLASFASWATGQGHTCLPLSAVPGLLTDAGLDNGPFRDTATLRQHLLASPVVGHPGEVTPLILDAHNNLYLLRFHRYEEAIALALRQRATGIEAIATSTVQPLIEALFPAGAPSTAIDWQRTAAVLALCKRFLVISGGPGTGKTYTVARILALLTALSTQKPRIALAAPTGKAALRLQESIHHAKTTLPHSLAEAIPDQAQTLHRLLGFQSHRPGFLHNATNPLHLDLLILDEASMIDVPLMAATLDALPAACRVILLGDRDQLASVEAGNLFGDLCGNGEIRWSQQLVEQVQPLIGQGQIPSSSLEASDPLADSLVILHASRRFAEGSGISALSRAVNTGNPEILEKVLLQEAPDLHIEEGAGSLPTTWLKEHLEGFFLPLFTADSPRAALQELSHRRILCALREGPSGVEGINRLAETLFRRKGQIPLAERVYRGMPILILRNDYGLGLFNGDTGILWPDDQGTLQAWFPLENGAIRPVGLARLPAWQTSYAITVHKSQGSEFAQVLFILPQDDVPILSRELLYTGITRAREHLTLVCRRDLLLRAIQRRVVRYSGLGEKLRRQESVLTSENPL